jgi:hypothetical protein
VRRGLDGDGQGTALTTHLVVGTAINQRHDNGVDAGHKCCYLLGLMAK